jgi:hypothetical protein
MKFLRPIKKDLLETERDGRRAFGGEVRRRSTSKLERGMKKNNRLTTDAD